MRYILYARKSSESEDRQVQSIEDQLRILRQLAAERGLDVIEEIHESRSAKDPGTRPGFDRMLELVERGRAEGVLCWNVNRLSRNPIDSGRLSWLLQRGVLQIIQTPEKPYLPSDNVLIFSVETGMANQYVRDLSKAVRRGTDSKIAKGWSPHRAPEGYVNDLRGHTVEADPERFAPLQRAWRLLIAGTHTPAAVIDLLNNEWGYRTRPTARGGGGRLSRSGGYRLFTNVFYAGYFRHGGQVHRGAHPPMVTLSEFEAVQRRVAGQSGRAHRRRHEFAYTGLIRCGRCGAGVTADVQSGHLGRGRWVYYRCGAAPGRCTRRSIREDVLEERIDACLARITITAEFGEIVRDALEKWITKEFGAQEAQYGRQLRALADGERMANELLELRLRRLIDDAEYEVKRRELAATVGGLRLELGRMQERLDRTRKVVEEALEFRLHARERFLTGDLARRREIARALGVRYVLDEGRVFIELHPLLVPMQPVSETMQPGGEGEAQPVDGPEDGSHGGRIEPPESGSGSTKRADFCASVPVGWGGGTEIEPRQDGVWEKTFRLVWESCLSFPA